MIKTIVACTLEIDEPAEAVREILGQLDLDNTLLAHSVGLLSCYSEFIDSGVVKALCGALPFPVVGTTTIANAACGELGQLMLTLTVLTSDDVFFSAAVSGSIAREHEGPLADTYKRAHEGLPGEPVMMLAYAPLIFDVSGDVMIESLDKATGGLPIFGTVSCDHTPDYATSQIIHNGEAAKDVFAMVLLSGEVQPAFWVGGLSEQKAYEQKAIITNSQGNLLQQVNDTSVLYYMETIGLSRDGKIDGINAVPFLVDFNDGTKPVVRAIFALTDKGEAVCGGAMPVGATLSVISMDADDVLSTTAGAVTQALARHTDRSGLLMFSCIGRFFALGVANEREMESVITRVGDIVPYSLTYSGGEFCPMAGPGGKLVNRFHNNTFIACSF